MTPRTPSERTTRWPSRSPPATSSPPPGPLFGLDALDAAPLRPEPCERLLVPGCVRPAGLGAIDADCPAIAGPTAFAVEGLACRPVFTAMFDRLRSDEVARRISAEFGLDV